MPPANQFGFQTIPLSQYEMDSTDTNMKDTTLHPQAFLLLQHDSSLVDVNVNNGKNVLDIMNVDGVMKVIDDVNMGQVVDVTDVVDMDLAMDMIDHVNVDYVVNPGCT